MANQGNVVVLDGNGSKQNIACLPLTWDSTSAFMQATMVIPWNYTNVTASGATVIKNAPGTLAAIVNLYAGAAQSITITAYDNATSGSGNILANTDTLDYKIDWPPGGIATQNGIVIDCSDAPTAPGLLILWL
jgi:hypothetical protein